MFYGKTFETNQGPVVAICDKDLLNTTIECNGVDINVSEDFYGNKEISEDEALKMMKGCVIGNIIGKQIVTLAERHGFITKENVISIGGTSHAQFLRI